jgi:hypothetical protein
LNENKRIKKVISFKFKIVLYQSLTRKTQCLKIALTIILMSLNSLDSNIIYTKVFKDFKSKVFLDNEELNFSTLKNREEYAVSLRKKKKDEILSGKRYKLVTKSKQSYS